MQSKAIALLSLVAVPSLSAAQDPLICFGNEPSWSVDLTTPGTGEVTVLGEASVIYKGRATALAFLGETVWRGTAAGGDLVVFMRKGECSDGMSDARHPLHATRSPTVDFSQDVVASRAHSTRSHSRVSAGGSSP